MSWKEKRLTIEERRERILTTIREWPDHLICSTNMITHNIWPDWISPQGSGSHPLTRTTGRILRAMEREGMIRQRSRWSNHKHTFTWILNKAEGAGSDKSTA